MKIKFDQKWFASSHCYKLQIWHKKPTTFILICSFSQTVFGRDEPCADTHRPGPMCWGAAAGRALCPPWWAKLSPLQSVSTQMRLTPAPQLLTFIPVRCVLEGDWAAQWALWSHKVQPTSLCGGTKGKRFKGYSLIQALQNPVQYCEGDSTQSVSRFIWLISQILSFILLFEFLIWSVGAHYRSEK